MISIIAVSAGLEEAIKKLYLWRGSVFIIIIIIIIIILFS